MVPQQHHRRRRRRAAVRTGERRIIVARGAGGFGFTIAGQRPCVVSAVASNGPAERAGLRAGDAILAVDGAIVSRAPHAAVARLVAAAPQAISMSVAPRESQPTDTEDTEPDERARTRRRHPPPRRRPQHPPLVHHPGCLAAAPPSTSGVNEILQNLTRAQLSPSNHTSRLECRAVVGYLGTIETPRANSETPPASVKTAVRRLRQERRPATPVLLSVLPNVLFLRRPSGQTLAQYGRDRIVYAGCSSDADRRYFGLVTSAADISENETEVSNSCHVFAVDPRLGDHEAHIDRAREFQIFCSRDPVAERCLEFPPSAEYVVGIIKGMYSLPSDECSSPALQQISKLAVKGDSPLMANFSRDNRLGLRMPRVARRPNGRNEENGRLEGPEFVANSPQPSNHSEITTTSSNSDSGIGFHNDGRNIADRILVVDFAGPQPINRYRPDVPRRPMGLVGCNSFDEGSFLSNTTPVVDGFGGQGRPLNHLEDVMLNPNDLQSLQNRYAASLDRNEENPRQDTYNYNNVHYSNLPSTSRASNAVYDPVYTENESHYELIPHTNQFDLERVTESLNSVEIYEEQIVPDSCQSNEAESVDNVTVISGTASKASMDSVSVYSTRSHEEARPARRRHMQASLDDMLVIGMRDDEKVKRNDDDNFLHPASVKCKVRKNKPMNLLSKTKQMLTGKDKEEKRRAKARSRALSASAGDVCASEIDDAIVGACSEPDLRDSQTEQSSPFRRWTTGGGAGSSYRHHEHTSLFNKQMSEGSAPSNPGGGVARWSLGLEHLLQDPAGAAAFAHFLAQEFATENYRFWWSCEQYNKCNDTARRAILAQEIWQRHLADGASEPVNVDSTARRTAGQRLAMCPPDLFQQAQKQIFNLMKFDSYPRFLRSSVHAECARADLRGAASPYAHQKQETNDMNDTHPKLKKSASNASERRRSGGASLLPWKLRAASKDRAQNASNQSVNGTFNHTVNDVSKSVPPVVTGCSLCRVVLPDGATSVSAVEPHVTVRALVERLLQRRNIHAADYDVLLADQNESGKSRLVDPSIPSNTVGGRCLVVERRCMVRVQIRTRLVMVRARPTRTLQHALKPVLARYLTPQPAKLIALKGQEAVPLTTTMSDLDGCRIEIVELSDGNGSAGCGQVLDGDSDSDVNVRLQDDADCQSEHSLSKSVSTSSTVSSGAGGTVGSGRVRAALRAGAPLHHHPPEFLDNLRETQRQRLQNKPEPPPLPPKPRPLPPAQPPAIV